MKKKCYHCGLDCDNTTKDFIIDDKVFCCLGCKSVFEILTQNNLEEYYKLNSFPGVKILNNNKYDFLEKKEIETKLLSFSDEKISIVDFFIPNIHCSSCIWLLEKIPDINSKFISVRVNFIKRTVKITYNKKGTSLKEIANYISELGYSPKINLNSIDTDKNTSQENSNKKILYQLGIAGFVFGNTMLFALPEYFQIQEFWLDEFKYFFRWLMFFLSIPVLIYSSQPFLISAYKGIRNKLLNIDIPISLGIIVLFLRSSIEIIFNFGSGYFDSFSGLIFFLLLGRYFQRKTYDFLSFERDYKSYFPLAVIKLQDNKEIFIELSEIKKNDILLIKNEEIIPADCILKKGIACIDNSFITGESSPISKDINEKIYAGGKQIGSNIEVQVLNNPSQSYLTQLWNNDIFNKSYYINFNNITNYVSKYFTIAILLISIFSFIYWSLIDLFIAINVITSILIVACPCALALSAPFTLGNILRYFSNKKFFIKNTDVIEKLSKINHIVFDKTGTLTKIDKKDTSFIGENLSCYEKKILKTCFRISNHPFSRLIYDFIDSDFFYENIFLEERKGTGIIGKINDTNVKIGSGFFLNIKENNSESSCVHVEIEEKYLGFFSIKNVYRKGIEKEINLLSKKYKISILSGDNYSEKEFLEKKYPFADIYFEKKPKDKLDFIKNFQKKNYTILMIGDGLNDSGALKQSNVGISISDNINNFSPASDIIMDSENLKNISLFLKISKRSIWIIYLSFFISFSYNFIGLYFAVKGDLSPIISAILMPISSISVVAFSSIMAKIISRKLL